MDSGDKWKYLLTVWPGKVTPLPAVEIDPVALDGDWLELEGHWLANEGRRRRELPPELYLRELSELDLDDPAAIFEFTRLYGVLAQPDWAGLGAMARTALIGRGAHPQFRSRPLDDLARLVREELEERAKAPFTVDALEHRRFFHLDEVRLHARALRNMVRTQRVLQGDLTCEEANKEWEPLSSLILAPLFRVRECEEVTTEDWMRTVAAHLGRLLNAGLAEFSVRASWGQVLDDEAPQVPPATTYGVLCLQLANHIAEGAPFRHCAACGRLFVRKEDPRYTGGQERWQSGVKYCSDRCTNRIAKQRQLARRRAKEEGA